MKTLQQVDEMPTEGQFVAVWMYNNRPWSLTLRYKGAALETYDEALDEWRSCVQTYNHIWETNTAHYIIVAEE